MSLKNAKEIETNKIELEIKIERDAFNKAVDAAYKKNVKKIQIPGFRKGKAPKGIIEKYYGKGVFYEDAINEVLPAEIEAGAKEAGYTIIATPEITDVDFENEDGVIAKVSFIRKPDVKLGDYKGIKLEKTTVAVEDAEVDADLEIARKRLARNITIEDRAAEMGDITNIDYEGFVDGVAFDGGKGEGHKLTLGSGQFIPGFEEQIVGKKTGEEFDVNVTFPEEYHAEELKGKAAVFKCKLNAIEKEELPALDDEFAKDASEFDTLDEYKADIKAKIVKKHDADAERKLGEALAEALCALVEAEIPEVMYDKEKENLVREYDSNLRQQGMSLDMFMQYTGMTLDSLKEHYSKAAEINVKRSLALEKIIEIEGITATEEDIEAKYTEIANAYGMKAEDVKKALTPDYITDEITYSKAFEKVREYADITEKTVTKAELEAAEAAKATETAEEPKKTTRTRKPRAKKADAEGAEAEAKTEKAETEAKPKAKRTTKAKTEKKDAE